MPKVSSEIAFKRDVDILRAIKNTQYYKVVVDGYNKKKSYSQIYQEILQCAVDEKNGVPLQKIFGVSDDCDVSEDGDDFRSWCFVQNEQLLIAVDLDINDKIGLFRIMSTGERRVLLNGRTSLSPSIMKKTGLTESD